MESSKEINSIFRNMNQEEIINLLNLIKDKLDEGSSEYVRGYIDSTIINMNKNQEKHQLLKG